MLLLQVLLHTLYLCVDITVEVIHHSDGHFSISRDGRSCRVKGHVTEDDSGRQTAVIDTGSDVLQCDSVVRDNNVYLFTEVRIFPLSLASHLSHHFFECVVCYRMMCI